MEYYKNLSLEDLFYIDDDGLVCCEEWRDISEYEGYYQVSNLGRVKSIERKGEKIGGRIHYSRILKQVFIGRGYLYVSLYKNKTQKNITIHILVGKVFLGYVIERYVKTLDHKNSIKTDNRACNLQVLSQRENVTKERVSKTGYTGVYFYYNGGFQATLLLNKKTVNLGVFNSALKASLVREKAISLINDGKSIKRLIKRKTNINGYAGVSERNGRYRSIVTINKKTIHLGTYSTPKEANEAYYNYKLNL